MSATELRQEHIDFQANLYESANPTRRWLHNIRREWVMRALDHVAQSQPQYLEIGIGCGIYTRLMSTRGRVLAIDINPVFVDAANQIPNVIAQVSDITANHFPPVHDVALCSEVLEHVQDSESALKNIHASLKQGGYLILTTPNSYSTVELTARLLTFRPVLKMARLIYGESVDDLGHINRMTHTKLRGQIKAAGFQIIRHENLAFYLPVVAEFFGEFGTTFCKWCASKLEGSRLSWLLWTQCWILRRPQA